MSAYPFNVDTHIPEFGENFCFLYVLTFSFFATHVQKLGVAILFIQFTLLSGVITGAFYLAMKSKNFLYMFVNNNHDNHSNCYCTNNYIWSLIVERESWALAIPLFRGCMSTSQRLGICSKIDWICSDEFLDESIGTLWFKITQEVNPRSCIWSERKESNKS